MMKNIIGSIGILTTIIAMFVLVGCGGDGTGTTGRTATKSDVEKNTSGGASEVSIATYTLDVPVENNFDSEEFNYITRYTLTLKDETNATFLDNTIYDDTREDILSYNGTYTKTDYGYEFVYTSKSPDINDITYQCYVENDVMTEVLLDSDGVTEIAGVYTGYSDEYGEVVLTIKRDSTASLDTVGGVFTGYCNKNEGRWNLMAYSEDLEESIDWYVYFSGTTFTYRAYYEEVYGDYAGSIIVSGMMGDIEVYLTNDGSAYATVKFDNQEVDMYGYYYVDNDAHEVQEISLSSDAGYAMTLNIKDIGEKYPNYSGTVTYPMAAG